MTRYLFTLDSQKDRAEAVRWCNGVGDGTIVEFRQNKRTLPQNDRMWKLLTIISQKVTWHGMKLSPPDWKDMFMEALSGSTIVPNITGDGMVALRRTSKLTTKEHSTLTEIIEGFAEQHGVGLKEPEKV